MGCWLDPSGSSYVTWPAPLVQSHIWHPKSFSLLGYIVSQNYNGQWSNNGTIWLALQPWTVLSRSWSTSTDGIARHLPRTQIPAEGSVMGASQTIMQPDCWSPQARSRLERCFCLGWSQQGNLYSYITFMAKGSPKAMVPVFASSVFHVVPLVSYRNVFLKPCNTSMSFWKCHRFLATTTEAT